MVLDRFMNGFIWALYERKWKLYGRKLHWTIVSLDATLIVANGVYSFLLKSCKGGSNLWFREYVFLHELHWTKLRAVEYCRWCCHLR